MMTPIRQISDNSRFPQPQPDSDVIISKTMETSIFQFEHFFSESESSVLRTFSWILFNVELILS